MTQLKKIEGFLMSLERDGIMKSGQLSMVMPAELELLGGDNNGTCINKNVKGCEKNANCTNYGTCDQSSNSSKCTNDIKTNTDQNKGTVVIVNPQCHS